MIFQCAFGNCFSICCIYFYIYCFFIIIDTYIQKAKKNYQDSRTRRTLNRINDELVDVQRVMVQNIDDVLQRGEQLSGKQNIFYSLL